MESSENRSKNKSRKDIMLTNSKESLNDDLAADCSYQLVSKKIKQKRVMADNFEISE